jgi:hypothetical protein
MPITRLSSSTTRASGVYPRRTPLGFSRRIFSSVHPAATVVRETSAPTSCMTRRKGPSILRDLDGELGQWLGEFGAFVVPMTALNDLEAERSSRKIILQVDVKCSGHEVVVSRRGGTETPVRVRPY